MADYKLNSSEWPIMNMVWWHFSDLHWEVRSSTDRRGFLRLLFQSLEDRSREFGRPHFVVLSGDIAYSGEENEYLTAEQHFFTPLRAIVGPDTPFYFVAGNHDLRRVTARTVNPQLISSITSTHSLNEFLDNEDFVETVRRPFAHFDAFCTRHMPDVQYDSLGWWHRTEVAGRPILFVGVNTAWASSYQKDSDGSINDERHLLVGQKQLLSLAEQADGATLSILILHHPGKWLNGYSDNYLRQIAQRHADIVLFGHTHDVTELSQTLAASGTTVYIPAPATYDRADTDTIRYARGYNVVTFDADSRQGAARYFKYSDAYAIKFDSFTDLYPPGHSQFDFDLANRTKTDANEKPARIETYADAVSAFPGLQALSSQTDNLLTARGVSGRR